MKASGVSGGQRADGDRGGHHRQAGAPGGADPDGGRGRVPFGHAFLQPARIRGALPIVLGHESAGIVEQVGEHVSYVRPGDHVITCLSVFCGHCEYCLTGHMSLCQEPEVRRGPEDPPRLSKEGAGLTQFANLGSFAEQMLVHEHSVVKVREDMPLDRAALIGCGVTTGVGAAIHTAAVEPGSTVAVIGCGGVGLSAINGAAIAGAARVIAVDMVASKLDLARKFGATDAVDASAGDVVQQVRDLTDGGGPLLLRGHRAQGHGRAGVPHAAAGAAWRRSSA